MTPFDIHQHLTDGHGTTLPKQPIGAVIEMHDLLHKWGSRARDRHSHLGDIPEVVNDHC